MRASVLVIVGLLAGGCTVQIPGSAMPQSFLGLGSKIQDSDLTAAGYRKRGNVIEGQRWSADSESLVVKDGRVVSVENADGSVECIFTDFVRAHLSPAAAVAVLRTTVENKAALSVGKPVALMVGHQESGANMVRVSCVRWRK